MTTDLLADLALQQTPTRSALSVSSEASWLRTECRDCGPATMLIIARTSTLTQHVGLAFARCSGCMRGYVIQDGSIHPGTSPARKVEGLPVDLSAAWNEVRETISVGANSSAVMMCRKILFYIAVEKGMAARDKKGYAPNFGEVLKHLSSKGIITPAIEPWVKHIKDIGNEANHDIAPITEKSALEVVAFTEQLLTIVYAMPAKLQATLPIVEEGAEVDGDACDVEALTV